MKTLSLLVLTTLLAGCGGAGAGSRAGLFQGNYTGSLSITPRSGTVDETIVLDVDAEGKAEGSVVVAGTVCDFTGRVGTDGALNARGEGIDVQARLVRQDGTLSGLFTLSDGASVRRAQATFSRVPATE